MNLAQKIALGISLVAASASAPATAQAQRLAPFDAVGVESGGQVVIRPGQTHSVRILSGDPRWIRITSDERGLWIRGCEHGCQGSDPRFEVVMPAVEAIAVHGGGEIRVSGGFAPQSSLAAAVHGGGRIDTSALRVGSVAASVAGGGEIVTRAETSLAASVRGGGLITYSGSPQVAASTQGGGAIRRADSH